MTQFFLPLLLLLPTTLQAETFDGFKILSGLVRITDSKEKAIILTHGGNYLQKKKGKAVILEILSEKAMINASGLCLIGSRKGAEFELLSYATNASEGGLKGAATVVWYRRGKAPIVKFGRKRVTVESGDVRFASRENGTSNIYAREQWSTATVRYGKRVIRLKGNDPKSNYLEDAPVRFISSKKPKPRIRKPFPKFKPSK